MILTLNISSIEPFTYEMLSPAVLTAPTKTEVERIAQERWNTRPDWWIEGRAAKNITDNLGELPAGLSYSGVTNVLTVTGNVTLLDGWDFAITGTRLEFNSGLTIGTISNCKFGFEKVEKSNRLTWLDSGAPSQTIWEFNTNNSTTIARVYRCWFAGPPGYDGGFTPTAILNHGTTDDSTYPFITLMEFCSFEAHAQDAIKGSFGGEWRYCYFDTPTIFPKDATQWDSGTTYNQNDVVYDAANGYQQKICEVNGTVGTSPNWTSATSSNATWRAIDPHGDPYQAGQSPPSGVEVYGCFFTADQDKRRYPLLVRTRGIASNGMRHNSYGTNPHYGDHHFHHNISPLEVESNFGGGRPLSISATTTTMHPGRTMLVENNWYASNSGQIVDTTGSTELTVQNNTGGYTWWSPATLSGLSASYSGGVITYGYTATVGGWATIIVNQSATALGTSGFIYGEEGVDGCVAKFELDAPANTVVNKKYSKTLSSGTYYAHMLYQAGPGIYTTATTQQFTV